MRSIPVFSVAQADSAESFYPLADRSKDAVKLSELEKSASLHAWTSLSLIKWEFQKDSND